MDNGWGAVDGRALVLERSLVSRRRDIKDGFLEGLCTLSPAVDALRDSKGIPGQFVQPRPDCLTKSGSSAINPLHFIDFIIHPAPSLRLSFTFIIPSPFLVFKSPSSLQSAPTLHSMNSIPSYRIRFELLLVIMMHMGLMGGYLPCAFYGYLPPILRSCLKHTEKKRVHL
jgi:hypothetical protein